MGRSHPLPQSLHAAFSTFTDVINNQFNWDDGTPQPIMTADQMASAFEAQSADGLLPNLSQRFRHQMNIGGSNGGSDDSGGEGDDSNGEDINSDKSDDDSADDDGELKVKKVQRKRIRKQHEANKGYHTLFNWYRSYLITHGAELRQSHLDNRNECRTLRQKIMELDGQECAG
jgi:hypothetical protein